jgi:hypothetical protein
VTSKSKGYKSEKHRLAHPFQDATSDWLRENDEALDELRKQQQSLSNSVRALRVEFSAMWLDYCKSANAPKAVVKQAEQNFKIAQKRAES